MRLILVLASFSLVLASCSSKEDANAKNFGTAIDAYLEKNGQLCIGNSSIRKWPMEVAKNSKDVQKFDLLEKLGLATKEEAEIRNMMSISGDMLPAYRYSPSPSAEKYFRKNPPAALLPEGSTELCYGHKRLDKVVKWDTPGSSMKGPKETVVTFSYKIMDLADWANNPEVQAAFSEIKTSIDFAGKEDQKERVKLTSEGWEVSGFFR